MAINFPSSPVGGQTYLFEGVTYTYVDPPGHWSKGENLPAGAVVASTAPLNPQEGTLWYDTINDQLRVYTDDDWEQITGGVIDESLPVGSIVASAKPLNPQEGMLWYDTTDNLFLVYLDDTWVQLNPRITGAGTDASTLGGENLSYVLDLDNATGTLDSGNLSSDVTLQGNTFNTALNLVQMTGDNKLPSLDASDLDKMTGASAGTYGSATTSPVITVDSKGRITDISPVSIIGGGGGGGGLLDAYTQLTDGTTTATALSTDVIKFRSANSILTTVVGSNDPTHGDNVLFTVDETNINHDNLAGFVANEHIDHSTITINAGQGLSGSGDITSNVNLNLDVDGLSSLAGGSIDGANDYTIVYDTSVGTHFKVLVDDLSGVSDHGGLTGLTDDDHTLYSLADGTRWTTTPTANRVPISNGSGNLVVSPITDTELGHLDGVTSNLQTQIDGKANTSHTHATSDITSGTFVDARIAESNVTQHEGAIDHDALTNFVGNEHINHSTVSIATAANSGLAGGGNLTSTRNLSLNIFGLSSLTGYPNTDHQALIYDVTGGTHYRTTLTELLDHSRLENLGDDDHSQYSLADGSRWTATPTINRAVISDGSGNLVVSAITTTELDYLDGVTSNLQTQIDGKANTSHTHATSDITSGTFANARISSSSVTQHEGDIDHDALTNFVGNEHIDHSTVTLTAGVGLSGGGTIASNRTFNLDFNSLTTENSIDGAADVITFYDNSAGEYRKTVIDNLGLGGGGGLSNAYVSLTDGSTTATASGGDTFKLRSANSLLTVAVTNNDPTHGDNALFTVNEGSINHNNLTNYSVNRHIDHSTVSITAGTGLSGGGDLTSTRNFSLDINGLTTTTPDSADSIAIYDSSAAGVRKTTLTNLGTTHSHAASSITSGTFDNSRISQSNVTQHQAAIDHDALTNFVSNEHIDHSTVSISTGVGLSGGGTIASNRTINLDVNGLTADASPVGSTDFILTYDASAGTHKKVLIDNLPGGGGGVTDHGALTGLSDDDHTLYSLADGSRWTTTPTINRAVISDGSGDLVVSAITTTELGHLDGVSSNLQTQLDGKASSSHTHSTSDITSGTFADARIAESNVTQHEGAIDHGSITGLSDDDHTLYSLADGSRWTTIPTINRAVISDGSGNLVVSPTTSTELGYLSGVTSSVQTQLDLKFDTDTDVNHDATTNFVANEHIDHTSVTLTAGVGLSGGGDISSNRTFDLDIIGLTTENSVDGASDSIVFYDNSAGAYRKTVVDNLGLGGGGGISNAYVSMTDGTTTASASGGDTFKLRSANGLLSVAVESNDVTHGDNALFTLNESSIDHGSITGLGDDDHTQYSLADGTRWTATPTANRVPISNGSGNLVVSTVTDTELGYLSGVTSSIQTQIGTKFDASSDVDHDATTNFLANEHIDHTSVTLTAGEGLTGGGDISSNRTFDLDINSLTADVTPDGAADYVLTYDASAASHKKVLLDDLPGGGGGGASDFTDLNDTPANYTSQASKFLAVNSGETAIEFIDAPVGVSSGSTLPSTPTDGQFHLHTPTGRTWLMQYDGSDWYPLVSYGTTTIYMTNSASGSTDWNEGHSSGTALSCNLLLPNLPNSRKGTITILCSAVTFTTSDIINIPPGLSGAGDIVIQGNTTTEVSSTIFSSGSSPYQSWTMNSSVGGGSEGDILEYVSGTLPANPVHPGQDVWCLLSVTGSTINLPGGVFATANPSTGSEFRIKSRNTTWNLSSSSNFSVNSSNIIFKYLDFNVGTGNDDFQVNVFPTTFVGCGFDFTGAGMLRTISKWQFIGCYFSRTDNSSRFIIFAINDMPSYLVRSLVKSTSTNSPSSADLLSFQGRGVQKFCEIGGSRAWHTQSGARIGRCEQQAHLRLRRANVNGANYTVVGGGTADNWDVVSLAIISGTTDLTKSGTSGSIANVDATSVEISS